MRRCHCDALDVEYKVVADAIPERLRMKFAEEDRLREKGMDGGRSDG